MSVSTKPSCLLCGSQFWYEFKVSFIHKVNKRI